MTLAARGRLEVVAELSVQVLVDVWCPVAGIWHLLRGHVLPVLLLALFGGAIGSALLAVRGRR